ncbi:mfs transporter [Ophiostoma piceae UAMH 11346]|uniref:Mfs transporter n=1 Tax=Ophiostoma piceae (strain UAMH 11346) TaxID=1262450 RepID=S3CQW4_OPHP1|nr:mfs transporter [Ophiostoma piceae UAMH 11346]
MTKLVRQQLAAEKVKPYQSSGFSWFSSALRSSFLSPLVGPFLATCLTVRTTWRAYFYLLGPVRKIDYWGVLSASAAVIVVLIHISGGGFYFGWDSPMVISMLVIGSLLFVLFVSYLLGAAYQISPYYLPLFLQNARGYNVIESVAFVAVMVLVQSACSILSGRYLSRRNRYGEVIWCGFTCWTLDAGLLLLHKTRTNRIAAIIVPLFLVGAGLGMALQPTLVALQAALKSNSPAKNAYLASRAYYLPTSFAGYAEKNAESVLQVPRAGICLLTCILLKDVGQEPTDERETERGTSAAAGVNAGGRGNPAGANDEDGSDNVKGL